jgi:thymidylate synthase
MKETERELWEMGIDVHPQSMQDKMIADEPGFMTKEVTGYSFKIVEWSWSRHDIRTALQHFWSGKSVEPIWNYICAELDDRTASEPTNPGRSYLHRESVWTEFLHTGKFAYTYSERIIPQLVWIVQELRKNPETRQAIINIHSNIKPMTSYSQDSKRAVVTSVDLKNRGGGGRIPCSMYYQFLIREGQLECIYTMRSCDLLTHFPIDVSLALGLRKIVADQIGISDKGMFTYFAGSLHAYYKDIKEKGVF